MRIALISLLTVIALAVPLNPALAAEPERRPKIEQDDCSRERVPCEQRCDFPERAERLSCQIDCRFAEAECRSKR